MSERLPSPEQPDKPRLNEAQAATLSTLCARYGVEYNPDHYWVRPASYYDLPGYATGWIGGDEYEGRTIYVGVDQEGAASS